VCAGDFLAVNLGAARAAKLLKLGVERLPVGADSGIAKVAVWGKFRKYLTVTITHCFGLIFSTSPDFRIPTEAFRLDVF
jgi:hypothetical protein